MDLAAVTGSTLLDPMNLPFEEATRSSTSARRDLRVVPLPVERRRQGQRRPAAAPRGRASDQPGARRVPARHQIYLQERIGKLTGGIARLKVIGASNGELKEKRDRAEDAVCAVRGAIKHGCLPGGGWTLLRLMAELKDQNDQAISEVLIPALFEPVTRLLENVGITEQNDDEFRAIMAPILKNLLVPYETFTDPETKATHRIPGRSSTTRSSASTWIRTPDGILDSTPAVLEAIRNSLSIASLLGTSAAPWSSSGTSTWSVKEARDQANFVRDSNTNEANERP
jgi:chaperonin GroEL (HSP60 family)